MSSIQSIKCVKLKVTARIFRCIFKQICTEIKASKQATNRQKNHEMLAQVWKNIFDNKFFISDPMRVLKPRFFYFNPPIRLI